MPLPSSLQLAINQAMVSFGIRQLTVGREELTERYREHSSRRQMIGTEAHRHAYVIARLPATFAAIQAVLHAVKERAPCLDIRSVLDLGAGPGTGMWAACMSFPDVETVTLVEKDSSLAILGQRLTEGSEYAAICSANWEIGDLEQSLDLPPSDLVIFSYSIGEVADQERIRVIERGWKAAKQLLVIVEPGTPAGFERIRSIRRQLIEWGAHLIAPCPHHAACPMTGGDWCHFSVRIERSSLHRRIKGGTLGHEDEKFSYVAATKIPFPLPQARILSHPLRHSGHLQLKLCTREEGLQYPIISKKMGDVYKAARKAEWGDVWDY